MKEAFDFLEFITESNKIEGINLPKEDFSENIIKRRPEIIGQIEAIAYANAVRYPLKIEHIESIHFLLSREFLPPKEAGKFRRVQVRVGPYIKVDPFLVSSMMKTFCEKFNRKEDPMETHYYFEVVHPFLDFNGRTGRILFLTQQRLQKLPLEIIRAKDKSEYYKSIREYELKGEYK